MNREWIQRPILLIACVAMLAVGIWFAIRPTAAPLAFAGPTPQELDSLRRYLERVPPAPELDDYDMYIPAAERPFASLPRTGPPTSYPARRLSAILFAGGQPLAIIDDQQVRAGGTLSGGGRVVTIERDHVVIREADGAQRALRIGG